MRLAPILALMLAPAPAQSARWQLAEQGGVLFRRTLVVDAKTEPVGAPFPEVWSGPPPAGILLAGELDAERVRRAAAVCDLRELIAQMGFDLGVVRAGTAQINVRSDRLQPVRATVTYGAVNTDGEQAFTAVLELDAKRARLEVPPASLPRVQGQLRGTRIVDAAKGLVQRVAGTCDLTLDVAAGKEDGQPQPARRQTVHLTDTWEAPVVLAPGDAAFKERVVAAIKNSIAFLRAQLDAKLGTPWEKPADAYHDVQTGELALLLLALLRGGESGTDPLLQRGFEVLNKRVIADTYSLAVAILAVEALHTPANEWAEMRAGRLQAPMPRVLPAEQLALVRDWTRSLLDNVDTSVDVATVRAWSYGPAKSWDNSNTQYALLGAYAALLCGVDVPSTVWTAAARHWLKSAIPTGTPEVADLVHHQELEHVRGRATGSRVQPLAWSYGKDDDATGSMTAAGIGGLTLCGSALRWQKKGTPKVLADVDAAVRAGFLWLQQGFTVRRSAGPLEQSAVWHHYYLYGLERACELNHVAWIGGRDWYFEGALHLLATQAADGSWGEANDSAFGLLFLKKAALPVITPR